MGIRNESISNLITGTDNIVHIEKIRPPVVFARLIHCMERVDVWPEWTVTKVLEQ